MKKQLIIVFILLVTLIGWVSFSVAKAGNSTEKPTPTSDNDKTSQEKKSNWKMR